MSQRRMDDFVVTSSGRSVAKPKFFNNEIVFVARDTHIRPPLSARDDIPAEILKAIELEDGSGEFDGDNASDVEDDYEDEVAEDDDDGDALDDNGRAFSAPKRSKKKSTRTVAPKQPQRKKAVFDPEAVAALAKEYPDAYWTASPPIDIVNKQNPIRVIKTITHPGFVYGLALSNDGSMLATASASGSVKIWDLSDFSVIQELRDVNEQLIEEFYSVRFSPDDRKVIAAGKLKRRDLWNEDEEDLEIAPGPIKIFDIATGEVLARMEGHTEEILAVKTVMYKGKLFVLSGGQDGRIIKWPMLDNFSGPHRRDKWQYIDDMTSNIVFAITFVPHTGNRYFIGACDDRLKLYDLEEEVLVQDFSADELTYSCYCDCVKFVEPCEIEPKPSVSYLITRGVELLKDNDSKRSATVAPNSCHLRRLTMPKEKGGEWLLENVMKFEHSDYISNSWPIHVSSNGRYIFVPTSYGELFVWNLRTGQLVATLVDHEERELRDVQIHPTKPLLFTCGHDGVIKVYSTGPPPAADAPTSNGSTASSDSATPMDIAPQSPSLSPSSKGRGRPRKVLKD